MGTHLEHASLAWVSGVLQAFAWFNDKSNNAYTFKLDTIAKPSSAEDAIKAHLGRYLTNFNVSLEHVSDWPTTLKTLLRMWLFEFQDPRDCHLEDRWKSFGLSSDLNRSAIPGEIVERFQEAVSPSVVWKVTVETEEWYEGAYDDLAFEEDNRLIYLHFGVSD
ncbi:MAG: hypothetical protein ACREHD_00185 [Pirellulales bacterium]